MKKIFLFFMLILLIFIPCAHGANPKPDSDDLVLPMPEGESMVFRPVFIGEGDKPLALKEFKVGDRATAGFKEYPTSVVIGGSFIEHNPFGKPDWLYYMGKYEVTESQYYAVMDPGKKKGSLKPIVNISWFDAQEFINKYNLWLFENAKNKLPKNEDATGFLRLPTEIEWEFAARGGSAVDPGIFDKRTPYSGPLSKFEWFSGPSSSHGKIKNIGILLPNDLKLYDMLGNVSEMTCSLYMLEYYQGRTGGFVSKGGNCFTSESKIRSSLRDEIPFYKSIRGKTAPAHQPILGMRLVMSSPIYASRNTSKLLATAWDEYVKTTRSAPVSKPIIKNLPRTTQTNYLISDAMRSLKRLKAELSKTAGVSRTAMDQLGLLSASFQNIESLVKKAEHDSAFAWIKVASETAYLIYTREMKELPGKQKALEIAKKMGKSRLMDSLAMQIRDKKANIKEGLSSYGFAFMQLEKIKKESIEAGFKKYNDFLARRGAKDQIRMLELVKKHYKEYYLNRRLDIEKWKRDLENFK